MPVKLKIAITMPFHDMKGHKFLVDAIFIITKMRPVVSFMRYGTFKAVTSCDIRSAALANAQLKSESKP